MLTWFLNVTGIRYLIIAVVVLTDLILPRTAPEEDGEE